MSNETCGFSPGANMAVGIGYIAWATLIIPLHIICSWLMWHDKEMRSSTYQFMINLSVADVVELVIIGWYAGAVLLINKPQIIMLERWVSFLCLSAWYANCVLFVFIGLSRWISLTRPHLTSKIFTKRGLLIFHLLPWALILAFYFTCFAQNPTPLFPFYPCFLTWGFDMSIPLGKYLHWHNFTFNMACTLVEAMFNVLSLKWVHETRKNIQTIETAANRRREIKLLIQCSIIGSIFMATFVTFTIIFTSGLDTPTAYLAMQAMWTTNHSINPFVYLTVNSRLRRRLLRFIGLGKLANTATVKPMVHSVQITTQIHPHSTSNM